MPTLKKVKGLIPSLYTPGGIIIARRGPKILNAYHAYETAPEVQIHVKPCVVHTASGRDLEMVPEADRNRETIQVYTLVRVYVADAGKDADIVIYRGRRFKVIHVEDYWLQGGVYISIASLEDPE